MEGDSVEVAAVVALGSAVLASLTLVLGYALGRITVKKELEQLNDGLPVDRSPDDPGLPHQASA
jgi:uncharacterized protein (DUF697 family)